MALWVKKPGYIGDTTGSYTKVKFFYVKKPGYVGDLVGSFVSVTKAFVKKATGWSQFWPKNGPFTDSPPILSTDSAGFTVYGDTYMGSIPNPNALPGTGNVYVPQTIYLNSGVWNANSFTINGFTGKVYGYTNNAGTTGGVQIGSNISLGVKSTTNPSFTGDFESNPNPKSITVDSNYDDKYLVYEVTANTTQSVPGLDSSDSYGGRIHIIRRPPVNISSTRVG